MALIYITGIAGSGKSTVRQELLRRGYKVYGGAEDGIAAFFNNDSGKRVERLVPAKERTPEWLSIHSWRIPLAVITKLRLLAKDEPVYVCAYTSNDKSELWGLFDKIFALTTDKETIKYRITNRTNNDVGKTSNELKDILNQQKTAEEEYQKLGAIIIDAKQPITRVVDEILEKT
jgi:adenylate kinase family enzyme